MNLDSKLIVLVPVKNEDWILQQFLSVTSLFADCIIIADQNSIDESRNICKQFPKAYLIENKNESFNESERQVLLIETARKLFPDKKRILIALDADEIITADSLFYRKSWQQITTSVPGTSVYFEKPDIMPGIKQCIRYNENYFPIAYIDDNIKHVPKTIHSRRIPFNPEGKSLFINDIKFMHFGHVRRNVQSAKLRYYSVIENVKKANPLYLRRQMYSCQYDENKFYAGRTFTNIPVSWMEEWSKKRINLCNFKELQYTWHDFEVLYFFKQYGYRKFHFENIWCFDWNECRNAALKMNKVVPTEEIKSPGFIKQSIAKMIDKIYGLYKLYKKN